MDKLYIVKYSSGEYYDYIEKDIFVTTSKSKATRYVTKFNRLLKKWGKYYEKFENKLGSINWFDESYPTKYYDRWYSLRNTNSCFWEEIEIR